jgi:hypothetical protein
VALALLSLRSVRPRHRHRRSLWELGVVADSAEREVSGEIGGEAG